MDVAKGKNDTEIFLILKMLFILRIRSKESPKYWNRENSHKVKQKGTEIENRLQQRNTIPIRKKTRAKKKEEEMEIKGTNFKIKVDHV